jgi:hypothetical protein
MLRYRLERRVTLVLMLAVFIATLAGSAHSALAADTGFNLTTSPLPIALTTLPGKSVATELKVQNSGGTPVKIRLSLLKFKSSGTDGQPTLEKRGPGDEFFDWVSFSRSSFVANPGVWNTVTMTVSPPKDSAFGYYYAVVFEQDNSADTTPTVTGGKLTGAAATLVLLNVQVPNEKKEMSIVSFTADKKLYEYLPTTFSIKVHNSGDIHLIPTGNIFISKDHKKDIAVLTVNENQGNVLPASNRVFSVAWTDGFPVYTLKRDNGQIVSDKKGTPIQQLDWNFSKTNKLRFGKYYAHLTLIYDNGTKDVPIDAEVAFWVVPWKLLPVAVILVILIFVGLWSSLKPVFKLGKKQLVKTKD